MRLVQVGPRNAKIVIVGEAPGAQEDVSGVPFSGGAGEVLNRMLSRAGINRDECFITNICHTRPPKNLFDWFLKPKIKPELLQGLLQLKADISEIKPNLVIALGAYPLKFLTGKEGIDKWRGSILEGTLVKGQKVIGTYHPAYIMRIWDYKGVAEFDLQRCAKQAEFPDIRRPERDLVLSPGRAESAGLVRELLEAEWLSVDIECWERDGKWVLACVGFSDRASRAVVWPCDEEWQFDYIKQLCESTVKKVFQNGQFDTSVLADCGIMVQNFAWDTMLGMHSLIPECAGGGDEVSAMAGKKRQSALKKGLAFQSSIFTEEPFYKDDGKLWKETGDLQMFWRYNALDAACTWEIREKQDADLRDFGTLNVLERELATNKVLMKMSKRGFKIDLDLRRQLGDDFEKQISNLQNFLDKASGGPVNVKSSKQVQTLLYDQLGLPSKTNRKTGNPSADKDAIVALAGKYSHPVLHTILEIRQRRDFVERYINAKVDEDGRMRCSFDVTGTRSGRLSSRQSLSGSGTNLQNIPSRKAEGEAIRRMFIADEGKMFVYRDFSQAEARVVAHLANCHTLIELFDDPTRDIHRENAARIFGKPADKITSTERYLAKRVVHACNYGMGDDRLVQVVNEDAKSTGISIDKRQAKDLIQRYFMLYPEIREVFWRTVENELRYTRTLNTPFGRKRQFFGRWDDKLIREAYSYIPQSVVGDMGCIAIINCDDQIASVVPGAEVMLNVHDSVMMQCDVADVRRVADMMESAMNIPVELNGRTFTIPSDCKVGYNWGNWHEEKNPLGLRDIDKMP